MEIKFLKIIGNFQKYMRKNLTFESKFKEMNENFQTYIKNWENFHTRGLASSHTGIYIPKNILNLRLTDRYLVYAAIVTCYRLRLSPAIGCDCHLLSAAIVTCYRLRLSLAIGCHCHLLSAATATCYRLPLPPAIGCHCGHPSPSPTRSDNVHWVFCGWKGQKGI